MRLTLIAGLFAAALAATGCGSMPRSGEVAVAAPDESIEQLLPTGRERPQDIAAQAEQSFQQGQFRASQVLFGKLMILDPGYRGTFAAEGLRGTCNRLGDDCRLVFAKYQLLADTWRGAFGDRTQWPTAQISDFKAILRCYDLAVLGRYKEAIEAGGPATAAPLPGFAAAAGFCVSTSDDIYQRVREREAAAAARSQWAGQAQCFIDQRAAMTGAIENRDWESMIRIEPAYEACAAAVTELAASGVAAQLGAQAQADGFAREIADVAQRRQRNQQRIDLTRAALVALYADPAYQQAAAAFVSLSALEQDTVAQLQSLEASFQQSSGQARQRFGLQIEGARERLREARRSLREVLARTNELRRAAGLDPRDRP
jgi:hypothetical protein